MTHETAMKIIHRLLEDVSGSCLSDFPVVKISDRGIILTISIAQGDRPTIQIQLTLPSEKLARQFRAQGVQITAGENKNRDLGTTFLHIREEGSQTLSTRPFGIPKETIHFNLK